MYYYPPKVSTDFCSANQLGYEQITITQGNAMTIQRWAYPTNRFRTLGPNQTLKCVARSLVLGTPGNPTLVLYSDH